jgi:hypothetical protein
MGIILEAIENNPKIEKTIFCKFLSLFATIFSGLHFT